MLVKELVEKLQKQNQEAQIIFSDSKGHFNNYISDNIFTDNELLGEDNPIVPLFIGPHDFFIENENSNIDKSN